MFWAAGARCQTPGARYSVVRRTSLPQTRLINLLGKPVGERRRLWLAAPSPPAREGPTRSSVIFPHRIWQHFLESFRNFRNENFQSDEGQLNKVGSEWFVWGQCLHSSAAPIGTTRVNSVHERWRLLDVYTRLKSDVRVNAGCIHPPRVMVNAVWIFDMCPISVGKADG